MSYVDLDSLRPAELVAHFVLECRGQALFLPYQDYAVIDEWLQLSLDADELLLILADVLPKFYARSRSPSAGTSLVGVRNLVVKRLSAMRMQHARGAP